MPIGLDDLRPRRSATPVTASKRAETRGPRSKTARPWTQDLGAPGLGLSRKRLDFTGAAMNEEWLSLFIRLPFTLEQEDEIKRWHRLQSRFHRLEKRVRRLALTPARTVRAIRRFCYI